MKARYRKVLVKGIEKLEAPEQKELLKWAEALIELHKDTSLSTFKRYSSMARVKTSPFILMLFKRFLKSIKVKAWDDSSWLGRVKNARIARAGIGFAMAGVEATSIALLGSLAGIKIFVMTEPGLKFLKTLVSEVKAHHHRGALSIARTTAVA